MKPPYFRRIHPDSMRQFVQSAINLQPKLLKFIDAFDIVYVGDQYFMINLFADFQKAPVISICVDDYRCCVKSIHHVFKDAFDFEKFLSYWQDYLKVKFPKEYRFDLEKNSIRV